MFLGRTGILLSITLGLLGLPGRLAAGVIYPVIYTNVLPGFPSNLSSVWVIITASGTGAGYLAIPFKPNETEPLLSITTAVGDLTTSLIAAGLYSDSGGEPGSLLENWSVAFPLWNGDSPPVPGATTIRSLLNPELTAGSQYWFVLTDTNLSLPQFGWVMTNDNTTPLGGLWVGSQPNQLEQGVSLAGTHPPGIEVVGLPEPGSAWLLALGAVMLMARRFAGKVRFSRL